MFVKMAERGSEVVDYIPGIPPTAISDFPEIFNGRAILQTILQSVAAMPKCQFLILPSTPELEGPAVEALKSKFSSTTNILPVGPLIPYSYLPLSISSDSHSYIHWLDSQPPRSVLYVSMGSFLSTSTTQLDEIIAGIKDSGVNYLLVTRGEEGVKERGYLVRWCDQLRVLSHCAVGGFWSHCGWNSTSEAMYAGVPMLTFPIMWDQLLNCKMAVDDFKIGMRVKSSGEEQLVMREEIGKIVREFMSGEGRSNIAAVAERIGEICRIAVAPGGSSACHLDAFVHEISRT